MNSKFSCDVLNSIIHEHDSINLWHRLNDIVIDDNISFFIESMVAFLF